MVCGPVAAYAGLALARVLLVRAASFDDGEHGRLILCAARRVLCRQMQRYTD